MARSIFGKRVDDLRTRKPVHQAPAALAKLAFSVPAARRRSETPRRRAIFPSQTKRHGKEEQSNAVLDAFRDLASGDVSDDEADSSQNYGSGDSEDDSDANEWDEESTLVAILHEQAPMQDENTSHAALVEQLRPAFAAASKAHREDLVKVLLPALHRVRAAHSQLAARTMREYAAGVLGVDDVCKRFEELDTQDSELTRALPDTQARLNTLFKQLKERYTRREQLQADFQAQVKEKTDAIRTRVNCLPGDMERLCMKLEKKSKELDKDKGGAAKARERILQGLLQKH
ncbi:hypothetical protein BV25DRAFT_1995629 [Artomyces pyxidatus]|uniref:Uncharacterized protein n=1 Tax=Artomyces pyxidatus TaxID=48021 RepID=A0ACB8SK56_9AGAM|nr:hypothetical protein BV25DRAFT_1995629 [Artomyces pyxidatus]